MRAVAHMAARIMHQGGRTECARVRSGALSAALSVTLGRPNGSAGEMSGERRAVTAVMDQPALLATRAPDLPVIRAPALQPIRLRAAAGENRQPRLSNRRQRRQSDQDESPPPAWSVSRAGAWISRRSLTVPDLTLKQNVDFSYRFSGITIDDIAIDTADFGSFSCKLIDRAAVPARYTLLPVVPGGEISLTVATVPGKADSLDVTLDGASAATVGLTTDHAEEQLPILDIHMTRTSDSRIFAVPDKSNYTVEVIEGPAA